MAQEGSHPDYYRHYASFRHWCSLAGFLIGVSLLVVGGVALINPMKWGGANQSSLVLELSLGMLGLGVVFLFSVFVFCLCSKSRSFDMREPA